MFCFSPPRTPDSSPSWDCERSRVSHAGIGSANFSNGFFRIDLLLQRDGVISVNDAATAAKRKTNKMTTSKTKTKNATTPTTKARVAKRSAKGAPLKAEPAPKAAGAKKPATAPSGGSKTDKILDLLK